jgi:oxalate decarboxylase/phosphoglucose isomerase-like protein (cupin superfamily)
MAEQWKTVYLDDPLDWPRQTRVELDESHADERGAIQSLVNYPVKNVSLITSKKGTIRSNHYHKTDWHYMYMMSGSADYYFRPTGSNEPLQRLLFKTGDLVFTPPLEDHATVFLEDSLMVVMSRNPRDQASYEEDVVRVTLVTPEQLPINNVL